MSRNKYPEKTEQLILDVATKLFLEKGYEKTSLNDIIINLGGLTKGAIYQHFKSKEEILNAVMYRLTASSDDDLLQLQKMEGLTGRDKLKLLFVNSLEAAFNPEKVTIKVDYTKNPIIFYNMIFELINEVAPMLVAPIIEEGVKDGSIKTAYPKQLAEVLLLIINIWLNTNTLQMDTGELRAKCEFMCELLKPYNLDFTDEALIKQIENLIEK